MPVREQEREKIDEEGEKGRRKGEEREKTGRLVGSQERKLAFVQSEKGAIGGS